MGGGDLVETWLEEVGGGGRRSEGSSFSMLVVFFLNSSSLRRRVTRSSSSSSSRLRFFSGCGACSCWVVDDQCAAGESSTLAYLKSVLPRRMMPSRGKSCRPLLPLPAALLRLRLREEDDDDEEGEGGEGGGEDGDRGLEDKEDRHRAILDPGGGTNDLEE